ncbi:MAG: pyridoxal-phosphate dependent enzyme [Chloroflexi bacterium]|nr:pyridoxal-phosphate dependent enzyme [Chloroflexota bacterium]
MPDKVFQLRCRKCSQPVAWPPDSPRCPRPSCRGPLQPKHNIRFDPSLIEPIEPGMWRYRHLLPPLLDQPVTLGEGGTPLLRLDQRPYTLYLKNESLNPTGSFKDRGAALLISTIDRAHTVIDDSSGNAGAALAAYAARAGMHARIYAPATAAPAKLQQIARYGAEIVRVEGTRDDATIAIEQALAQEQAYYASHIWHPGYVQAMQTVAWEIWEQLGRRAPDWVVLPAGNGTLLRGIRWGFRALQKGKLIPKLPHLAAVQAAACAPLLAYQQENYHPGHYQCQPTIADGVAIANPPLIEAMAAAIRKTKGHVVAVSEDEIITARDQLAGLGFYVEPTAALGYAALNHLHTLIDDGQTVIVILTGHGLKSH